MAEERFHVKGTFPPVGFGIRKAESVRLDAVADLMGLTPIFVNDDADFLDET